MFLSRIFVLVLLILNINYVVLFSDDVVHLRDHFITNLLEENRDKLGMQLTDEIRSNINLKIDAFLYVVNDEPRVRVRKRRNVDSNDLLLNEKSK